MIERKAVSHEDIRKVSELRAKGLSRAEIAEEMSMSLRHIKYIISRCKESQQKRVWYTKERTVFTDAMPNPFPKWWCKQQGLDHNFYRPKWKDQ